MNILITNDDGVFARGIYYLAKKMQDVGNVYVVAPSEQKSATGHAITMHNPLKINKINYNDFDTYSVNGTPADCTKMGIDVILKDIDIDFVLSGINDGPNLGSDVIYSGTVSAAIEGLIQGKKSIAFSYNGKNATDDEFEKCAQISFDVFKKIKCMDNVEDVFDGSILNVNIPKINSDTVKGYKITKLGNRKYINDFEKRKNPMGEEYYWMGGKLCTVNQDEDSDIFVNDEGYVSITPIQIDLTDYKKIQSLKESIK